MGGVDPPRVGIALLIGAAAIGVLPAFDVNPVPRSIREGFHFRDNKRHVRSEYLLWASLRGHTERWIRLGRAWTQSITAQGVERGVVDPGQSSDHRPGQRRAGGVVAEL